MKNTSKLLNFDSDRTLGFTEFRRVAIRPNRNLFFNIDREIMFSPNRDLNFGKKGVVFRTFVCSSCGNEVSPTDASCSKCGLSFEVASSKQTRVIKKKSGSRTKSRIAGRKGGKKTGKARKSGAAKKAAAKKTGNGKPRNTFQCPVCGRAMYVGTAQCPGCQLVFDFTKKGDGR